jgi:O-antigen ligase
MNSTSSSTSVPNPTPLLFLMAAALTWALLAEDAGPGGLLVIGVVLAPFLAGAGYMLCTRPEAGILALVAGAAASRYYVQISGLKAKPEHIIAGLLCLAVPILLKRREQPIRWIFPDYPLVAYIALNIFSSLWMSIEPGQTIKWAMQQALVILPYFLLRVLADDRARFKQAVRIMLFIGAAAAAYAILCFYSNLLFGTEFGVTIDQYETLPGTYGSQYEANILGAYCGACAVMMLAMYLLQRERRFLVGYAITVAGMAIGLSRAALGATLIAMVLVILRCRKMGLINKRVLLSLGAATFWVTVALTPVLRSQYIERFSTLQAADVAADPNSASRLVQLVLAFEDIAERPIFGGGTASFQLAFNLSDVAVTDTDTDANAWIGTTEIRVLHDTGAVGFVAFLLFVGSLAGRSWKIIKHEFDPELFALAFAAVVYLITFQLTEGTLLAFTWVHLGLIGCALSLYQASADNRERQWALGGPTLLPAS